MLSQVMKNAYGNMNFAIDIAPNQKKIRYAWKNRKRLSKGSLSGGVGVTDGITFILLGGRV